MKAAAPRFHARSSMFALTDPLVPFVVVIVSLIAIAWGAPSRKYQLLASPARVRAHARRTQSGRGPKRMHANCNQRWTTDLSERNR